MVTGGTARHFLVVGCSVLISGCDLKEVVVPVGEPTVVVQAVMRPDLGGRYLLGNGSDTSTAIPSHELL